MSEQRLGLVRIAMRRCGSDAVEKILRFTNDVWRCVECQMEDIGNSRADLRNRGRPARKFQRPSDTREMRQRVLHESVIALELLDRLFLTLDNIGELIDSSVQSRLIDRNVAQALERDLDCIDLLYQGIIIPQQPGAGRKQIAAQNALVLGKPIKLCERSLSNVSALLFTARSDSHVKIKASRATPAITDIVLMAGLLSPRRRDSFQSAN